MGLGHVKKASKILNASSSKGKAANKLKPDPTVVGAHTVFKRGKDNKITSYQTFIPQKDNRNPNK